ncbi:MAG: response regulator [Armatimonadia bacterium]|nr:response regulator [Armatimonadia bacterium]
MQNGGLPSEMIKVLVVEDVGPVRECIVAALDSYPEKYLPLEADTATSALHAAREQPDVVLLDLAIPEKKSTDVPSWRNGRQVLRWLRERWPVLPIICLTAEHERARDMLLAEGATDFLFKGEEVLVSRGQLLGTVDRYVGAWPTASAETTACLEALGGIGPQTAGVLLRCQDRRHAELLEAVIAGRSGNWSVAPQRAHCDDLADRLQGLPDTGDAVIWTWGDAESLSSARLGQAVAEHKSRLGDRMTVVCVVEDFGAKPPWFSVVAGRSDGRGVTLRVPSPLATPADVCELMECRLRMLAQERYETVEGLSDEARQVVLQMSRSEDWPGTLDELEQTCASVLEYRDRNTIERDDLPPQLRSRTEQTRHAAVLSCDVVDSTGLKREYAAESVQEAFERYHRFVHEVVADGDGEVASVTGDGVLILFEAAEEAVLAALGLRDRLEEFNVTENPLGRPIVVRIGISTGMVPCPLLGDTVSPVVDLAAKLQEAARPGEVLACEATFADLDGTKEQFHPVRAPVADVRVYSL